MVQHVPKSTPKHSLMRERSSKWGELLDSKPQRLMRTIPLWQLRGEPSHSHVEVANVTIHKMLWIDILRWIPSKDFLHCSNLIKKTMVTVLAEGLDLAVRLVRNNNLPVSNSRWSTNTQRVRKIAHRKRRMILGKFLNNQAKKQINHFCLKLMQ